MGDRAVDLLVDMLRIYSPSGREKALAHYLARAMKGLGFNGVRMNGACNVVGEVGTGPPSVLLCGHMDTVPGRMPVKVTDKTIFGRGAVDAKSSLAAMIMAASRFAGKSDGRVIVGAVVDEEGQGQGIRELIRERILADYAIFGEPSGADNITIGYKGRISLTIKCRTPSFHASAPWMSQNAIEKALQVWEALRNDISKRGEGKRSRSITACITKIRGGSAHNVLPGECELTIDVRVPHQRSCSEVYDEVMTLIRKYQEDVSFPQLEVKVGDMTEPFESDRGSPVVRALARAIIEVRGKRPMLLLKTGTGDMNVYGHTLKVPVVTYGPGNPHLSHTEREGIELSEYLASIDVYERAVSYLLGSRYK